MILPLWFYVVSPWIGIALTLACVAKLIHIDVFPGSARVKAFMRPTVTPPTAAELAEEQAVIAHLRATGYRITDEYGDDDKPLPLPRRLVHPIVVHERESELLRATVRRIRVKRSDDPEVA